MKLSFSTSTLIIISLILFAGRVDAVPAPFFRNFTPSEYDARSQNWSLAQDCRGFIYAGNNSCLLRFNGKSWDKFYPFGPKEAIIRSIYADDENGRVYIGGFREFGYFEYNDCGEMVYTSLYGKLQADTGDNDEIWHITRIGRQIFFIYFTSYYIYDLDTEELHKDDAPTSFFYLTEDSLYLVPSSGMLRRFSGNSISYDMVQRPAVPSKLMKVFNGKSGVKTAVTESEGLYNIGDGESERIDELGSSWGIANRTLQCKDGTIIVGFISSGVYAFAPSGDLLWHISANDGLIDNTVLALMEDKCGNIWCALDKGLAVIYKDGDSMLSLTGYGAGKTTSSLLSGDELYVGSNQGLIHFHINSDNLDLKIKGRHFQDSQIWSLYESEGEVIVGENGSTYIMSEDGTEKLSDAPGGATPREFVLRDGKQVLIQGSFTLLYVYGKENGKWRLSHSVEGFMRPVKNLETDYLGNIWIEHMYYGIYRITLSDDGRSLRSETFFPLYGTKLCKMGGRVLFYNKDGFMYYDDRESKMKPFDILNNPLGEYKDCLRVLSAGRDRYWIARKKDALLVSCHNDEITIIDKVRFNDFNASLTERFESALLLPDERFLFGLEDGFLIHDLKQSSKIRNIPMSIGIAGIQSFYNRSMHSLSTETERIIIPNNASLSIGLHIDGDKYYNADIRYELSPYDYEPRLLDKTMSVSYQRLPAGSYLFKAWRVEEDWQPDAIITIPVTVKPSVFASVPAILIYIASALALLYLAWHEIQNAMKRQRMRIESDKEKELISIRNEQLEESVLLKSKELATYSLIEARRNQVLQRVKERL
ncbi:MAG: hypothetical protein K2H95_00350, partial [Bacteroidales bacterium]|nr:hypothetical protein [Bacteroidales bacterium]